jgi:hypothetical protein
VLLAQARAVVGDPTAMAPADRSEQLDARIRPGSNRGQVRVGPSAVDPAFASAPHTASQRPKWVS